jgi:hypothetical protein
VASDTGRPGTGYCSSTGVPRAVHTKGMRQTQGDHQSQAETVTYPRARSTINAVWVYSKVYSKAPFARKPVIDTQNGKKPIGHRLPAGRLWAEWIVQCADDRHSD